MHCRRLAYEQPHLYACTTVSPCRPRQLHGPGIYRAQEFPVSLTPTTPQPSTCEVLHLQTLANNQTWQVDHSTCRPHLWPEASVKPW